MMAISTPRDVPEDLRKGPSEGVEREGCSYVVRKRLVGLHGWAGRMGRGGAYDSCLHMEAS